tara:strand:+ start:111 stop:236 length:126 start_codon:yes stop_codon:yes gene_type:complete
VAASDTITPASGQQQHIPCYFYRKKAPYPWGFFMIDTEKNS